MVNSCKVFYVRYKMRGTKHPWVHEQEFKVLENMKCITCIQSLVNPSWIFLGGGVHPTPPTGFLQITLEPLDGFAWNFVPVNKISLGTFWHKKIWYRTFWACVNMPFLTRSGIYRPEFLHENNDHPVSQVLDLQLSWNLP